MCIIFTFTLQIKPKPSPKLRSGKALLLVKKTLLDTLEKDPKRTPVLFFVTRTRSSDDVSKISEQIRGAGAKTVAIGKRIKREFIFYFVPPFA